MSGAFVENITTNNVNDQRHKTGICDNQCVGIGDHENEIGNNQYTSELRHDMLISQSFFTKERFKVLLGLNVKLI